MVPFPGSLTWRRAVAFLGKACALSLLRCWEGPGWGVACHFVLRKNRFCSKWWSFEGRKLVQNRKTRRQSSVKTLKKDCFTHRKQWFSYPPLLEGWCLIALKTWRLSWDSHSWQCESSVWWPSGLSATRRTERRWPNSAFSAVFWTRSFGAGRGEIRWRLSLFRLPWNPHKNAVFFYIKCF